MLVQGLLFCKLISVSNSGYGQVSIVVEIKIFWNRVWVWAPQNCGCYLCLCTAWAQGVGACPGYWGLTLSDLTLSDLSGSEQVAIEPKTKADLDKMGMGLYKLAQEDPSFHFQRDEETNQTVIEVNPVSCALCHAPYLSARSEPHPPQSSQLQ